MTLRERAKELAGKVLYNCTGFVEPPDFDAVVSDIEAGLREQIEVDARVAEGLVHPMNFGPSAAAKQIAAAIRAQGKEKTDV